MRKVILAAGVTLDGYIARPNGAVDYLFMPKDFSMAPFFASIDTIIMGRKTYDVSLQMGEGSFGKHIASYVLSRARPPGERDGVIFVNEPVTQLIDRIRGQRAKGKHIWLMGGGQLAQQFLHADLVDEIHLGIVPIALGEGIPLFPPGFPQRNFKLLENNTFSKGLVELKYQRDRRKR
jgi:dihydrofolate reductase